MTSYQKIENNLLIEGNIVITGTVDNRDINTDGTNLDNHLGATGGIHGISGGIVGTTDVQTLTNKTISGGSNTITLDTSDITTGTFSDSRISQSNITQHQASINHNSLSNYVANQHIDHSNVSIIAGSGLTGGGDITSSRTLDLDINGLDVEASPDMNNSYVAFFDILSSNHKKTLLSNISSGGSTGGGSPSIEYAESNGASSTTGTSWINKVSLSFTADNSNYLIMWSYETKSMDKNKNTNANIKIELNNTTILHSVDYATNNFGYGPGAGFQKVALSGGTTIDLDYNSSFVGKSVHIRRARLMAMKLIN